MSKIPELAERMRLAAEKAQANDADEFSTLATPANILTLVERIAELEKQRSVAIRLPLCSASPVCEMEANYAAAVSDCREAIRRAGYPIEGDD